MLGTKKRGKDKGKAIKFALNLNIYRNTHHQTLNKSKVTYKELMKEQILLLPKFTKPIQITYTLYTSTKRLVDISNVLSVVDKYFADALVEFNRLEDDNYLFVPKVFFAFGSVSNTERVEIVITEID